VTDLATAQLAKSAANSFLVAKIYFINAMAALCEAAGADLTLLARDRIRRRGRVQVPQRRTRVRRRLLAPRTFGPSWPARVSWASTNR
jgi:hypothetical protein